MKLLPIFVFAFLSASISAEENVEGKNSYITLKQHLFGPELERSDIDGKVVVLASWPSH
ncbi:MAG: hypothetical protein ACSHYB_04700 [Roseibacillus sp.]